MGLFFPIHVLFCWLQSCWSLIFTLLSCCAAVHACIYLFSLSKLWPDSDGAPRGSTDKQPGCHVSTLRSHWSLQPLHEFPRLTSAVLGRLFVFCMLFLTFHLPTVFLHIFVPRWAFAIDIGFLFLYFIHSLHVLMSAFTKFLKVFSAVCEILIILLGNCVFGDKPADPLCCRCTAVEILICRSPVSLPFLTFFPFPTSLWSVLQLFLNIADYFSGLLGKCYACLYVYIYIYIKMHFWIIKSIRNNPFLIPLFPFFLFQSFHQGNWVPQRVPRSVWHFEVRPSGVLQPHDQVRPTQRGGDRPQPPALLLHLAGGCRVRALRHHRHQTGVACQAA